MNMTALLLLTGFAFGGQPLFSMIVLILTAIIFLAAPFLMKCFIKNESIINDGTVMLRWQVITMICVGIVLLMTIIFQSMGKVDGSFILSISRQGIIFSDTCNYIQYDWIYGDYHLTGNGRSIDRDYCCDIILEPAIQRILFR